MRWPRRAKQSCWGGFASCRGGFRLAASLGRVGGYGERAHAGVSREASAARAASGASGSSPIAMDGKPARRPSRARRYPTENGWSIFSATHHVRQLSRRRSSRAGVRAVAQYSGCNGCVMRRGCTLLYGLLCQPSMTITAGRGLGRTLRNASLFASNGSLSFRQRCLCRRGGQVDRARDRSSRAENEPTRISKSTASAGRKTHRASHLQQRTSPSRKRSTQARPRRATPWLSQSKPGGGAPPAASLCCSLYVARPMPSRCRGDHSARHDGRNSG